MGGRRQARRRLPRQAGRIASYAATSSLSLGRPEHAVTHAGNALEFYAAVDPAERSPTREAISRLDLALALIAVDKPDAAADEALRALGSERVTGTVLVRADELAVVLRRQHPTLDVTREVHNRHRALTLEQSRQRQLTA